MNEQTEQLLTDFAEKLGTTTEYLFNVMVEGAGVNQVSETLTTLLLLLLSLYFALTKLLKLVGGN